MAGFVRDEKKTHPIWWLFTGGLFALSTVWATYAELTSRVPWQEHQEAFFDLELREAERHRDQQIKAWEVAAAEEPLKTQVAKLAELEAQKSSGDYAAGTAKVAQLEADFLTAEANKTFGASDLDETYYYRNLAEYERDAAQVKVRKLYREIYADEPERARNEPAHIYADPPAPPAADGESSARHHLTTEVARMTSHMEKAREAIKAGHPPELVAALEASIDKENAVVGWLKKEWTHQGRIDEAEAAMRAVQGPDDPYVSDADPATRGDAVHAARTKACASEPETINCIKWLKLGPVDSQAKQLAITVSKAKRSLSDAERRYSDALLRAEPAFDIERPTLSLIGPFQIQQIVLSWMAAERDVDLQQVDRCHTCHMGVDNGLYTASNIEAPFRTHPRRDVMMKAHPIDKFGCTACHQGQGRATDDLAHSGWQLEVKHGHERWHYVGDHYWEDPMLPIGKLTKVIIDDLNDTFEVKLGKGKKQTIALDHVYPTKTIDQDEYPGHKLLEDLQLKLQAVVDADEKLKAVYRGVARKLDNRVTLGFEKLDPDVQVKKAPKVTIRFPKLELAKLLGFGHTRKLESRAATSFVAPEPMVQPVRADNAAAQGSVIDTESDYKYIAPRGSAGLQVSDDMRNRFITSLPEVEAGCLRCHLEDVDLIPRRSQFAHVTSKLQYEKAEAELAKDPVAYQKAHGTTDLPPVADAAGSVPSDAPTLDDGRATFQQLNCAGCHLLAGFEGNPNQGPRLDDLSAKVTSEWLLSWLRDPRGWRAKTSMPNLWPRPLDPASKLPYAEGSPEHTKWRKELEEETVAVAAYLLERSEKPDTRPSGTGGTKPLREDIVGYANVPGADAETGKKLFEAYGCQGCHATTEGGADLPDAWRQRERDVAPTLANLKGKVRSVDWLAYWIEEPSRYWHDTSMPNLRLTRQEAASVAKYLVALESKPEAAAVVSKEEVNLISDAKLRNEVVPCTALGRNASRVDCGAKVIEQRGCFGCHRIDGFDKFAPIGPELTGFAQKDITTLDYGYAISDHHLQTTESFAALKLDAPRIFSRDRIQLKMGDFDMSADEIAGVVIFLKGATSSKPAEDFDPMRQEQYASAIRGRRLVNDLNCRGCHIIEGRGGDIDGWRQALLVQDPQRRAPFLDGEGARVQPEWLFTFLRDPQANGIRPWLHPEWAYGDEVPDDKRALRMPTFNLTPDQWTDIVRYFATWDGQPYPYQVPAVNALDNIEKHWVLANMNSKDTGNCMSCHYYEEFPVERAKGGDLKKMAPDIAQMRHRLRPEWVKQWLLRPHNYLPYTSMTAFFASVDRSKDAQLFRKESDPFLSPPPKGWQEIIPGMPPLTTEDHASLLRDFLFGIPAGVQWPGVGDEATSLMVDPSAATTVAEAQGDGDPVRGGEQPGG